MTKRDKIKIYRERMQDIVYRLKVVEDLLKGNLHLLYLPSTVEAVYLQFRNVLELIATASLVINDGANKKMQEEGMKKWHAGDILKAVKTVNPEYYYPKPLQLVEQNKNGLVAGVDEYLGEFKDFKDDYLTPEKFTTLYNLCGSMLHTPNPFDKKAIVRDTKKDKGRLHQAIKWRIRIINLLNHHKFQFAGEEDRFYLCHTRTTETGSIPEFIITTFEKLEVSACPSPKDIADARMKALEK